jgi:hypothetical protein
MWQKIDGSGAGVGDIGLLAYDTVRAFRWAMPFAIGSDTVTVLGGATDDGLDLVRTSSAGLSLTLDSTITRWPGQSLVVPAVAVRGRDLLVATAPKNRIRIARVSF